MRSVARAYTTAPLRIEAVDRLKHETGHPYPELGVTFIVTPDNHHTIEDFFFGLDLSRLGAVSIEMQSYVTAEQHRHYARVAHDKFGVTATPSAAGYVRDPAVFANVNADAVARQMRCVRDECRGRGIRFFSQPHTLDTETIAAYLSADWTAMADHHSAAPCRGCTWRSRRAVMSRRATRFMTSRLETFTTAA